MKKNSLDGYLLCGIALSVMLTACGDEEVAETDVSHEEIVMYETPGSGAPARQESW